MLTEDKILLFLHNDKWFRPSPSQFTKIINDEDGNEIEVSKSYYHTYSGGEQISIRVSEHGTSLNTWVKRRTDPTSTLQNLSVVFSNEPVTSKVETQPDLQVDSNGNKVEKYIYFVVEQYVYRLDSISISDFKKVINRLKNLDDNTVFTDPFKKKPSKTANRKVLTPNDMDGRKISSVTNPVHPRQTVVADNPNNEVDAKGKVLPESKIRINESQLRSIIRETIRRVLLTA